jgi:anti-sigma factor RsiW
MPLAPDCQKHLNDLSPYVDGELSPAARQAVDRHLGGCAECTARVADLRATSGLVRVGLEMLAEEADFSNFAQGVMARITPEKAPWYERLGIAVSELFTYQRWQIATGLAVALLAVLAAAGWLLRPTPPAGYGSQQIAVRSVETDARANVAPVVMKTREGDTIIWTVNPNAAGIPAARPDSGSPPVPGATPVQPPAKTPTGGEL